MKRVSTRTIPPGKRHLNPRTHSLYCRLCGWGEDICTLWQAEGSLEPHKFTRRTIKEQAAFDALTADEQRAAVLPELTPERTVRTAPVAPAPGLADRCCYCFRRSICGTSADEVTSCANARLIA